MELEYIDTSKKEKAILLCKYKYYHKNQNKNGSNYWKCRESGCSASVTTLGSTVLKLNGNTIETQDPNLVENSHSHPPLTDIAIAVTKSLQNMRIRAESENEGLSYLMNKINF